MSDTAFCGACGAGIQADSRFCPSCGASQHEFQAAIPPKPEEPPEPGASVPPAAEPPTEPGASVPPAAEPPTERLHGGPQPNVAPADELPAAPIDDPAVHEAPTRPAVSAHEPAPAADRPEAEIHVGRPSPPQSPASPPRGGGGPDPGGVPPAGGAPFSPPPQGAAGRGEGRAEQFAQRVETFDPEAGAFAKQLAAGFQTPGVLTALLGGLLAALGCFFVGLILALSLPDESIIGSLGSDPDTGVVTEALGQTVGLLLAKFEDVRVMPMLLVLVPIAACALATFSQAGRTRSMAHRTRLISAAAVGIPFALAMLIAAAASGDLEASTGGAFLLGLLWGSLGGVAGMALAVRREAPEAIGTGSLPAQAGFATKLMTAALKPLVALLVLTAVIGTGAWWLGSFRDHDTARFDRSLPVSLVENTLFAGEHAVNYAALGAGVQFTTDEAAAPVPLDNEDAFSIESELRLFDLGDDIEAYFFIPLLVILIALPALLALYAGFAVARAAQAPGPELAAAWGAVVGPVWAIALALLSAMHVKLLGNPEGGSLFGIFLLGGAVLGALGGLLSTQSAKPGPRASVPHG